MKMKNKVLVGVCKCNLHVYDPELFELHSITVETYPKLHEWVYVPDCLIVESFARIQSVSPEDARTDV